jgi:hypothetical protein
MIGSPIIIRIDLYPYLIAELSRSSRKKSHFSPLSPSLSAPCNYPNSSSFTGNETSTFNIEAIKSMISAMGDCGDEVFKVRRVPLLHTV